MRKALGMSMKGDTLRALAALVLAALVLAVVAAGAPARAADQRPSPRNSGHKVVGREVAGHKVVGHKLLVISVDGLDWRYLRDADALGLAIPHIRRLMADGDVARGVVGVYPTITWPSHTSIITGVRPDQHGILSNARRDAPFTESYWSAKVLKAPALWGCAAGAGLTTAAITWPVTLDAAITFNLPEVSIRRNGGSMDLESVAAHATPGLVGAISRMYPSFPQQWVDDRTRTLATLYLLHAKRPDLILLHFVDLDSDQHDRGPFEGETKATLERTDELVGDLLAALPRGYDVALVSDHGFERIDRIANIQVSATAAGLGGAVHAMGGVVVADTPAATAWLKSATPAAGVGREIPKAEVARYAPALALADGVFEPEEHVMFGRASAGPEISKPEEKGEHGLWPTHSDYRSVFLLWGANVPARVEPEIQMLDIEARLAGALGLRCPPGR